MQRQVGRDCVPTAAYFTFCSSFSGLPFLCPGWKHLFFHPHLLLSKMALLCLALPCTVSNTQRNRWHSLVSPREGTEKHCLGMLVLHLCCLVKCRPKAYFFALWVLGGSCLFKCVLPHSFGHMMISGQVLSQSKEPYRGNTVTKHFESAADP